MFPRKQTAEPKLLILVSFFSGEVTSCTDTNYCIPVLLEVCRSVFYGPPCIDHFQRHSLIIKMNVSKMPCSKLDVIVLPLDIWRKSLPKIYTRNYFFRLKMQNVPVLGGGHPDPTPARLLCSLAFLLGGPLTRIFAPPPHPQRKKSGYGPV